MVPDTTPILSSEAVEFETTISEELFWRAQRRSWWLRHWLYVVTSATSINLALTIMLVYGWQPIIALAIVVLNGILLLAFVFRVRRAGLRRRHLVGVAVRYRMSPTTLEVRTPIGASTLHWHQVREARAYDDMWLICLGSELFFIIPRAELDEQAENMIKEASKAAQAGGRCTKCGYSLRGLAGDRCPECGHEVPSLSVTLASTRVDPQSADHTLSTVIPLDHPDVLGALRQYYTRLGVRNGLMVLALLIVLFPIAHFGLSVHPFISGATVLYCLVGLGVTFVRGYQKAARAERQVIDQLHQPELHISVGPDGYRLGSDQARHWNSWSTVKRAYATPTLLVIKLITGKAMVLPRRWIPDEMIQAFLTQGQAIKAGVDAAS
jgi:hypothetical protein